MFNSLEIIDVTSHPFESLLIYVHPVSRLHKNIVYKHKTTELAGLKNKAAGKILHHNDGHRTVHNEGPCKVML